MRIAVVGSGGYWGFKLARCFNGLGCEVVTVDASGAARFACLTDALPVVDAVSIATPASTHFMLAREALLAGKHVLCEKPLALVLHDAVKLKPEPGQVLMAGHTYLFNDLVREFKRRMGIIGPIQVLSAIREGPAVPRIDCDVLYDLAVHDVAIQLWLMGRTPVGVSCTGTRDHAQICLRWYHHEHARSHITASWQAPEKVRRMYAAGVDGFALFDEIRDPPKCEPLMTECREFLAACEGAEYVSGWEFSVDVARVLHAAFESQIDRGQEKLLPCIPTPSSRTEPALAKTARSPVLHSLKKVLSSATAAPSKTASLCGTA